MRFTKRVVGQGHVTVPSDLRSALGIHAGDLVEFEVIGVVRRTTTTPSSPSAAPTPAVGA